MVRPLRAADLPAFVACRREPAVARFQTWDTDYSLADAERLLAALAADRGALAAGVQLALADRGDGALVGDCFALALPDPAGAVEVGVTLATRHQGRGLAVEAVCGLVSALFELPDVGRIIARTDERNAAAQRAFERAGFRRQAGPGEAEWCKRESTTLRVHLRQRE